MNGAQYAPEYTLHATKQASTLQRSRARLLRHLLTLKQQVLPTWRMPVRLRGYIYRTVFPGADEQ